MKRHEEWHKKKKMMMMMMIAEMVVSVRMWTYHEGACRHQKEREERLLTSGGDTVCMQE